MIYIRFKAMVKGNAIAQQATAEVRKSSEKLQKKPGGVLVRVRAGEPTMTRTRPDFDVMIRDCFQSPEDVNILMRFYAAFRPYMLAAAVVARGRKKVVQNSYP